MTFPPAFFRTAALCSFASALTTLALIFLPQWYQPVADFDARMALLDNPAYVLRSWIYLLHPFLVVTAALAVAVRCRLCAPGAALAGLLGFLLWGVTEAGQQTLTLVAMDRTWRAAWPTADAAARELIRNHVAVYDVIWDAMFFLLLLGFLIGNVFLARAAWCRDRAGRWVSAAFAAAAVLTLLNLMPEFGVTVPFADATGWLYPVIQPAGRALIGWWLWHGAGDDPAV